jgi:serine/threonine protein kinase
VKALKKAALIASNEMDSVFVELGVLLKVSHPFVIQLHFAFQTSRMLYLGLEYMSGGDLFERLSEGGVPIEDARIYIGELALALDALHRHNIIYRDLKPENVLLTAAGHVKLIDFGVSKILEKLGEKANSSCGTIDYLAPEVINGEPYTFMVDWWAFGVLSYELIFGIPPWQGSSISNICHEITNAKPRFPPGADPVAVDFLTKQLEKDPGQRPTLRAIKAHPFFEGVRFRDLLRKRVQPSFRPHIKEPPGSGTSVTECGVLPEGCDAPGFSLLLENLSSRPVVYKRSFNGDAVDIP